MFECVFDGGLCVGECVFDVFVYVFDGLFGCVFGMVWLYDFYDLVSFMLLLLEELVNIDVGEVWLILVDV